MASNASSGIPPGRSTEGGETVRSTIVDSTPTVHGPPSRTRSTSSPRSSRTCCAVVGLTWPKRFADGAAMPPPERVEYGQGQRVRGRAERWCRARRSRWDRRPCAGAARLSRAPASRRWPATRRRLAPWRPSEEGLGGRDVDDERMVWRPALDGVGAPHGVRVRGVGAQSVHGLGGHGDQSTGAGRGPRRPRSSSPVRPVWSRRDGVQEPEHGVDERERLRGGEVVGVAQLHEPRVGQRGHGRSAGPAKSLSPSATSTGAVTAPRSDSEISRAGRCSTAASATASLPGCSA